MTQRGRESKGPGWRREKVGPTLKLLQIRGLDVSTHQIRYMGQQRLGVPPRLFREVGDGVLKRRIVPRVAC
jgi:hypothetical protein